jgi:ABC-2 type transport system ATP-binding protein
MAKDSLPVVQTVGLAKSFKDFWRRNRVEAVKDLNLEIRPGEVFGLLGPNGSGKSTTIKMILGLLYPTRGRISVFGRPPSDVAIKKRIGYLPEESYLYRFLDARETLSFYGRIFQQHSRVRRDRIEMLLQMVGLKHEAKRRIGEYSKGMARRIGLAQALINDPEFLILDEPTSGLDPLGTRQIKDVIRRLGQMGKTILLSSHLLADVEDVCDRICILYGGQQRAEGTINDLLSHTDLTQLTADRLSPETIEEIRALVHRRESKTIDVATPRGRLEHLFLDIVQQAQTARVATSGVGETGAIPEFLGTSTSTGDAIIRSLIDASDRTAPAEPIEVHAPEAPGPTETQVLVERLMAGSKKETRESKDANARPEQPSATPDKESLRRKSIDADRGVIDNLLGRKPGDGGEGKTS